MKKCDYGDECFPICDFCKHYAFNGEPHERNGKTVHVYVGKGECKHPDHPHPADPADGCHDFHCHRAE